MDKIKVRMIGGKTPDSNEIQGGVHATTRAFLTCFENDPEIDFKILTTDKITDYNEIREFVKDSDIIHLDENTYIAKWCEDNNINISVLGPTIRSPVKRYGDPNNLWRCPYSAKWFYSRKVIRLNYNEEKDSCLKDEFKGQNFQDKVTLISHCVDTDYLKPVENSERYLVLWAGDAVRPAKNFEFFRKIMEITQLPSPFKFKVLSGYRPENYWKTLDETAVLVNTSKYESYCAQIFEGMAKGVPTIYPKGLHGKGVHEEGILQVEYTPEAFKETILKIIADIGYRKSLGIECRKYCESFSSPKLMRDELVKIYKEVLK